MFRHYSLAIYRLIMRSLISSYTRFALCCIQWGDKRWGWYEIWRVLCRVGGVGTGVLLFSILGWTMAISYDCMYIYILTYKLYTVCNFMSQINYRHYSVDKKNKLDVTLVFFISILIAAQHVSGNHVPIISSWRLRDVIVLCWYVPWLQEGGQVR